MLSSYCQQTAIALVLLLLCQVSFGQRFTVKGKITDSSGAALEKVSVQIKGVRGGTATAPDGSFTIGLPSENSILLVSSIGFAQQQVAVNGRSSIQVVLQRVTDTMADIIVVGYTQQTRAKTTAAVAKLGSEELKNTSNPNPIQALQGKLAGVSVPVTTGQPGSGANNIIIRGGTKLNVYGSGVGNGNGSAVGSSDASGPLVIVDGVFRSLDDINPDNIESLQVMKDAAATAIYGARGANGVIVVKTKGGKFNSKMNLSLNHRTTWETKARDYKYLDATQYLTLARTTVKNTTDKLDKDNLLNNGGFSAGTKVYTAKGQYGININLTALYDNIVSVEGQDYVNKLLAKGWQTMDDPINPGTKLLYADNHYQDMLWVTGLTNNDNIAVSGGGDKANYNVSLGYTDQAGIFTGTNYKRYDALGNFGFKAAENFRIDAMINYQYIQPNYVDAYQNELVRGTRITPLIRIFKDDGNPMPGELYTVRNRFHTLKYDDTRVSTERLVSRLAGDLTITKGLHWKPAVSYVMQDYRYLFMRKATPSNEIQPSTQRQKNENTNNFRQLMVDQILQYDFNVRNDHHFTLLGGFNYTRSTNSIINIGSQRGTNDYIYTINEPTTTVVNGVVMTNVTDFGTSLTESRSASFFGQLNYDYQGRYLLSGALRDDGFSNFAPENKYALFPSASAGWNIQREKFWILKPVSTLKLRGSWGQAGSSDLSITDTYGGYSAVTYAQGSGILRSNLSNPNLRWELTQTTDLAVDAGFLKDRITLSVDWYNKLTKNRLASKPLPSEAPFTSITYNNGVLQNKGVEIELGATPVKTKTFTWRSNFSFAYNKTLIKQLPANGRAKNRQGGDLVWDASSKQLVEAGGFAEGERPYGLWAYHALGVFATDAQASAWNATTKDNLASPSGISVGKHAGDYIFEDVNKDGVIDTKDQVFMGYRTPNIIGGMQNMFTYKGFTLRVAVDFAMGHLISNGALARSLGQGRAFNEGAPSQALGNDIWQKEGDEGKKYARFSFADYDFGQRNYLRGATLGVNQSYSSDVSTMIEKGDFLAFREISISYNLPQSVLKKIHSTGMNVFASVYNLGYITGYKGLNPESYTGFDPGGYPRPRQFSLGATLQF
ncbi:SusC/RagA family TonB-linked outer membrane protein [Deminuibacter soli]|uniref:SusC/RagA family TonB-linked outer membrane protein n=2 Tax=Deminuibacter soli TaxID=2291815 RepID=A0A3E1NHT8_9BACT|nr:SusC/RagA family TonB-linked outer membrane protein [Deminuibacter soli]